MITRTDEDPRHPGDVFRLLVEQTRELLCLFGVDGRFTYLSPSVRPVLGYDPGDLVGADPLDLVHEDDLTRMRSDLEAVLAGRETPVLLARFRKRSGRLVWLETQARGLRDKHGAITGLVTSSRDVSDRVDLLRRISEREATLASVIASFDDLVFVFDREGRFREYYQPRGHRDLYAPPEEFLGRRYDEMLPPRVSEPLADALERARSSDATQEFEYELPIDGHPRQFHAKITPMLGDDDGNRGFVGVVRDVTERKAAEEARLALVRATEHAERLEGLSVLARGTAHEFNNLLTTIHGSVELARGELEPGSQAREDLDDALRASERAARVTRRLVRYAGRSIMRWTTIAPGELVRTVARQAAAGRPDPSMIEVVVEDDVAGFEGDRVLVASAVRHLVRNALEALPEDGTGHVRLEVGTRHVSADMLARSRVRSVAADGAFVAIEVADDGEGVAPDLLPRVFDPFVTTRTLGRGMGLAEVAGTMRSHGGAVLMESSPGHGTSVTLLFPRPG